MSALSDHWNYVDAFAYLERVGKMPPTIVCVACNGGVQGKESNPNLPETPDEIAESVADASGDGASGSNAAKSFTKTKVES